MKNHMDHATRSHSETMDIADGKQASALPVENESVLLAEYRINPVQYLLVGILALMLIPLLEQSNVPLFLYGVLVFRLIAAATFRLRVFSDRLKFVNMMGDDTLMYDDIDHIECPETHNYVRIHFKDGRRMQTIWSIILKLPDRNALCRHMADSGVDVRKKSS